MNFLSHYLLRWSFRVIMIRHFFSFYNSFFYTQQVFVFHLLRDICNLLDYIVTVFLFLLCSLFVFSWEYLADRFLDIFIYMKKISLLNFDFIMIYMIHKILVLLKNHQNYLKGNIFQCFFKKYNRLLFFFLIIFF